MRNQSIKARFFDRLIGSRAKSTEPVRYVASFYYKLEDHLDIETDEIVESGLSIWESEQAAEEGLLAAVRDELNDLDANAGRENRTMPTTLKECRDHNV